MRLCAALLLCLYVAGAAARTITIEGGITLVVCDDFKVTHFADNKVVVSCSSTKFRMTITECRAPKLQTLSPGNYQLSC